MIFTTREMPEDIEDVFAGLGLSLFPETAREQSLDYTCPRPGGAGRPALTLRSGGMPPGLKPTPLVKSRPRDLSGGVG
jgi:hypothetical protein